MMAKLTKQQQRQLENIRRTAQAVHDYLQSDRTIVCSAKDYQSTTLDVPILRLADTDHVGIPETVGYMTPVQKWVGSPLAQLPDVIRLLQRFLNEHVATNERTSP